MMEINVPERILLWEYKVTSQKAKEKKNTQKTAPNLKTEKAKVYSTLKGFGSYPTNRGKAHP